MRVFSEVIRRAIGAAILVPALVGCGDINTDVTEGQAQTGEGSNGALPAPVLQSGFYMDPASSFLVTDVAVVEDGARTKDPCKSTSALDSDMKWTFGYLMKQMANGASPSAFARSWLTSWENSTTVNNDPLVEVRPVASDGLVNNWKPLATLVREGWERASGGTTLAMNKAPFRLLAIVNRFDLRKAPRNFGEGSSGELRFVFSVLDLDRPTAGFDGYCEQYPAIKELDSGERGEQMVILEYAVEHSTEAARRAWALAWADLTTYPRGSAEFASRLQALTEKVAVKGAGGTRANGSALIRIRTNETTNSLKWDLREFVINASTHLVVPTTVKQTPAGPLNGSNDLALWMQRSSSSILNGTYVVPDRFPTSQGYSNTYFRGSHALNQFGITFWKGGTRYPVNADVRHEFSKNTCSGCHSKETGSQFFHVHGREPGGESRLSSFLTGNSDGSPFCISDPVVPSIQRCFNELQRRNDDLLSYLNTGI